MSSITPETTPDDRAALADLTRAVASVNDTIENELLEFRRELGEVREYVGLEARSGYRPEDVGDPVVGRKATLARGENYFDWYRRHHAVPEQFTSGEFSLGRVVYGMATGDRSKLTDFEKRSLVEGTDSAGGYLTPEPLAAFVIDNIRNKARVFQAGATIVPMEVDQLSIARITGPSTPTWRAEATAVNQSAQTFDRLVLKTKTAASLILLSYELFDDLSEVGLAAIQREIVAQLALTLDLGILRGTGTESDPVGIRNQANVQLLSMGANGAAPTSYDDLVNAVGMIWDENGEPNSAIMSSRTAREYAKLKDGMNRPLDPPEPVQALNRLVSNQIPNNLTQGTAATASEIYVADFTECFVGMRSTLGLRLLNERYADTMQMALLAYVRADVQLAHPEHFVVVTGVL